MYCIIHTIVLLYYKNNGTDAQQNVYNTIPVYIIMQFLIVTYGLTKVNLIYRFFLKTFSFLLSLNSYSTLISNLSNNTGLIN